MQYPTFVCRRQLQRPLYVLLVLWVLAVTAACIGADPLLMPIQPQSPPPDVLHSPLIDNRWRVEGVLQHGQTVTFDLFKPMYVVFDHQGTLRIYSERCGSSRYALTYLGEQHYRIGEGESTLEDCGELLIRDDPGVNCTELAGRDASRQACAQAINAQLGDVNRALAATNEYELHGEELILRGEGIEMRLVLDNP